MDRIFNNYLLRLFIGLVVVFLFFYSFFYYDSSSNMIIHNKKYMASSDYLNFSNNLNVDKSKNIIDKIEYNTTVGYIKNNISTSGSIIFYDKNNKLVNSDSSIVTTGYKVIIKLSSSNQEYLISVRGDSNGDGVLSKDDIYTIVTTIVNNSSLSNIYYSASDYNNDKKINVKDMLAIADRINKGNETWEYINGYRCYSNDNEKVLYNITRCEPETKSNAKCEYVETSPGVSMTPVIREHLKSMEFCDGNIVGATGYSTTSTKYLKSEASNNSSNIVSLSAGSPFKILGTNGDDTWWKVSYNGKTGYVENAYMMINLPDYIPSLKFDMMNAKQNIYTASGIKLSVYGEQLYDKGMVYNYRLERQEYMAPVVYEFAKKILQAQKIANNEGYGLKIYDAYRPVRDAEKVRISLSNLYNSNSTVRNGIDYSYEDGNVVSWGQGWFIAQSLSAHSLGAAIDVVLVDKNTGKEIEAQSSIHDLSTASVKYKTPISGQTTVRNDLYSSKANKHTKDLDRIMLNTGMTNLASEWWHFQDNTVKDRIRGVESSGLNFQLQSVVSSKK